jgi:hypothetical protein
MPGEQVITMFFLAYLPYIIFLELRFFKVYQFYGENLPKYPEVHLTAHGKYTQRVLEDPVPECTNIKRPQMRQFGALILNARLFDITTFPHSLSLDNETRN